MKSEGTATAVVCAQKKPRNHLLSKTRDDLVGVLDFLLGSTLTCSFQKESSDYVNHLRCVLKKRNPEKVSGYDT